MAQRFITSSPRSCYLSPFLSAVNPFHTPSRFPRSILILSALLRLYIASGLFHSGLRTITPYTAVLFPIRATWPAFVVFHLITRIIFGEQYRSLSSSLCNCLQSPVTSSLLGPNIPLNTPCSQITLDLNGLREENISSNSNVKEQYVLHQSNFRQWPTWCTNF